MNKKKLRIGKFILVVALMVGGFSAFYNVFAQINEYNRENERLSNEIAEQQEEYKQLQLDKSNMHSDENYERIAREVLGMVKPGDKVYINSNDNK